MGIRDSQPTSWMVFGNLDNPGWRRGTLEVRVGSMPPGSLKNHLYLKYFHFSVISKGKMMELSLNRVDYLQVQICYFRER